MNLKSLQASLVDLYKDVIAYLFSIPLFQDDARVLQGKQELAVLHETLQNQQQNFNELSEHLQMDAAVPVTFTKVG